MKKITTFLMQVLVKRFYIINAGFFLFIFFMFFGIVYGGLLIAYHKSLILGMISSPVFMAMVWIAWLLYNIKCVLFCTNTINAADSSYLHTLKAVPSSKQLVVYFLISAMLYMPVLAYSFFVVVMAINRSQLLTALLVTAYQLLMILSGACMIFISINKNKPPTLIEKIIRTLTIRKWIRLGYYGFLPGNFWYARKLAFLIVKIFSILLLSVSFVRNGDQFDADLFSIFFQLIFVAHALLVFYCVDFSESGLQFTRNLPVGLPKVAGGYLFTYGLMLLPDGAFMLFNNHGNLPVTHILILYGTAVSTLFLYTAVLYGCELNMDNFMLFVFLIFLMTFFLQKTELHFLTMLAILLTAAAVFKTSYYSFERG